MSKLLQLNSDDKDKFIKKVWQAFRDSLVADKTKIQLPVAETKDRATLYFTYPAYGKMMSLVLGQDKEVGWHGIVERLGDTEFLITDIVLYPQTVTACTVTTDEEEYEQWLYKQPDRIFDSLKMHGHSHVNMGTSPSSTDINDQQRTVSQLSDDMFYIFLIWNKKNDKTIRIFDYKTNLLYETKDVDLIIGTPTDAETLEEEIKNNVKVEKVLKTEKKSENKPVTPKSKDVSDYGGYRLPFDADEDDGFSELQAVYNCLFD